MAGRSRFYVDGTSVGGQGIGRLDVSKEMPYNAELIQWTAHLLSVPTTSQKFFIKKESVLGNEWKVNVVAIDLAVGEPQEYICNEVWQFRKGDVVNVLYTNDDEIAIYVELVFREAQ